MSDDPDKKPNNAKSAAMSTYLVHGKFVDEKWDFSHHTVPPMSASVTYRLDSTSRGACGFQDFASAAAHKHQPIFIYDRLDEPTRSMLEDRLAQAEQGDVCVSFSTGMAAISAAIGVCVRAGDHIIAHDTLYGCTYSLLKNWLPRFGVTVSFCSLNDIDKVDELMTDRTTVIYGESPVNPNLELLDMKALRTLIDEHNENLTEEQQPCHFILDNTFATPYGQRPLTLGADIVCHSLTKNIAGFGTDMGGAVITAGALEGELLVWRKDFGAALSSRSAWSILVYGLSTLPLRVSQQTKSAIEIAQWLEKQPQIAKVTYPGLESFTQKDIAHKQLLSPEGDFVPGNMIYFETKESKPGEHTNCDKLIDNVAKKSYSITLAVSLGQLRTLIENPISMTHSVFCTDEETKTRLSVNGIRLSVGIEAAKDIISDLELALANL